MKGGRPSSQRTQALNRSRILAGKSGAKPPFFPIDLLPLCSCNEPSGHETERPTAASALFGLISAVNTAKEGFSKLNVSARTRGREGVRKREEWSMKGDKGVETGAREAFHCAWLPLSPFPAPTLRPGPDRMSLPS